MLVLIIIIFFISSDSEVVSVLSSSVISPPSNCSLPLGMQDGRIADSQITASSSYQETLVGPEKEGSSLIFSAEFRWNKVSPCNISQLSRGDILTSLQYLVTFFIFWKMLFYLDLNIWQRHYDTFLTTRPPVKCKTNYSKLLTALLGQLPPLLLINISYYISPFNLTAVDLEFLRFEWLPKNLINP